MKKDNFFNLKKGDNLWNHLTELWQLLKTKEMS